MPKTGREGRAKKRSMLLALLTLGVVTSCSLCMGCPADRTHHSKTRVEGPVNMVGAAGGGPGPPYRNRAFAAEETAPHRDVQKKKEFSGNKQGGLMLGIEGVD